MHNLSVRYGNVPRSRRRFINAPLDKRRFEPEDCVQKKTLCSSLRPQQPRMSPVDECQEERKSNEKWLEERRALRQGLNNMDLNSDYLNNKRDLTESEYRVLRTLENSKEKQRIIRHLGHGVLADKILDKGEDLCDRSQVSSWSRSNVSEDLLELEPVVNRVQLPPIGVVKTSRFVKKPVEGGGCTEASKEVESEAEEPVEDGIYEKILKMKEQSTEFYKKAVKLNVADTRTLRKALIYPIEVKSELLVNDMKEKAEVRRRERIMARLAHKRQMRDKYVGFGRAE